MATKKTKLETLIAERITSNVSLERAYMGLDAEQLRSVDSAYWDSAVKRPKTATYAPRMKNNAIQYLPPRPEFLDPESSKSGMTKLQSARGILNSSMDFQDPREQEVAEQILNGVYHDLKPGIDFNSVMALIREDVDALRNARASFLVGSLNKDGKVDLNQKRTR